MSKNASWIFRFTPYLVFSATAAVTLLIPLVAAPLPFDRIGDLLLIVYLLLLGTFFLALAGLDPGPGFWGMGADHEMTIPALGETTVGLAVFGLATRAGATHIVRD